MNCKAVRVVRSEDENFRFRECVSSRVRCRGVVSCLVAVQRILDRRIKLTGDSAMIIAIHGTVEKKWL